MDAEVLLKSQLVNAFNELFSYTLQIEEIAFQPTRKDFEGDYTFVTFPFGRITKKNPEQTAELLGQYLSEHCDIVSGFNVVKGFLNISIANENWMNVFRNIRSTPKFGLADTNGQKVVIEYSSPNTNKPLHLGHLRNNFLGYAVSQIMSAAGYNVQKVNLVNDRGIHICKSMLAYKKFGQNETPESSGIKGDHLIGNYYVRFDKEYKAELAKLMQEGMSEQEAEASSMLMQEARAMLQKWEVGDQETVSLWKQMNGWVYEGFDATYKRMGVNFDHVYYESDTYLLGKGLVSEGLEKNIFEKRDDGSVWIDLSDEGLDAKLLLRADGTSVYMTQDLGTAELKYKDYSFDKSIYVVGNEQDYHFDVLFRILKKLGRPYADGMFHLSYGMVDLPSGKMKSREGTVVDADDLMDEMVATAKYHTEELGKIDDFTEEQAAELYEKLALGALKYFLLKVDPKKRMLFNPEESIQFQGNTGPFIQYTHARISALQRKADELGIDYANCNVEGIQMHDTEREVIILQSKFPEIVKDAAENYAPSVVANFAYDLAKGFNRFYTEVSVFNAETTAERDFRVSLSVYTAKIIKQAMALLGVEVPERM